MFSFLRFRIAKLNNLSSRQKTFDRKLSSKSWGNIAISENEFDVGGKTVKLSTGKYARFADGCAVATIGDTSVMVTAVSKARGNANTSFLPLTVDYRQKAAAAGRIPTNYLRRDTGAMEHEILTSRMIDRSLRPLFPQGYGIDTQIVCNVLAADGCHDPEIASINAASTALTLSDIPWGGPIGAVRVGLIDNDLIVNPTRQELMESTLNLVVAGTVDEQVVMLEAAAENVVTNLFQKAIQIGLKHTQTIVEQIQSMQKECGKEKRQWQPNGNMLTDEIKDTLETLSATKIKDIFANNCHDKFTRDSALAEVRDDVIVHLQEHYPDLDSNTITERFYALTKQIFRQLVLEGSKRCDGREFSDLRDITCEVDLYKPLHGSAIFQRGQTQVLCTVTFDSPDSAARVDQIPAFLGGIKEKNFFLHYEFPPYSTNEIGRTGLFGRRELGHGALAERGLRPVVPKDFPFTIRLTSEVLESNGSSSMASVCGGSLALMDAGVNISEPAAGVAMGLITKFDDGQLTSYKVFTDQLGIEDFMGDMDFKFAGTRHGVTALQMDIKLPGIPLHIVVDAVTMATEAKARILDIMHECIKTPRSVSKPNAPIIENLEIPIVKRSKFLGIGGINLRKLRQDTGVTIYPIDEINYQIFAPNPVALLEAKEKIEELLAEEKEPMLEFGCIYRAKIVEVRDQGVMVQIFNTMVPTLIHNSQLDTRKVNHPSVLGFTVGQEIDVKYFGRDPANGKMRLSRRALLSPSSGIVRNLIKS